MAKSGYLTVKFLSSIESTHSALLFNAVFTTLNCCSHKNDICFFNVFVISGSVLAQDSLQKPVLACNLSVLTVTAAKPLIEKKQDRIIVNVDKIITASGGTAMDVFSKLPSVSVDPKRCGPL